MVDAQIRISKANKVFSVIKDFLNKKNKKLEKMDCLDIGGSTGFVAKILSPYVKSVHVIDIDKNAIEFGKKHNLARNVHLKVVDALDLPFKDKSIDLVICNHVYEHVANQNTLVKEIYRVLKDDGICYFGAGNKFSLIEGHYHLPFLSWIPRRAAHIYLKLARGIDYYYENHLTLFGLKKLLRPFNIYDYTIKIVKDPVKFNATDLIKKDSLITKLPALFLEPMKVFSPIYIFILQKRQKQEKNIAFFWSHAVGDFIVGTPLLRKIKNTYKNAKITYISVRTRNKTLFLKSPYINHLIELDRNNILNLIFDLINLRRCKYDLAFAPFPEKTTSKIIARLIRTKKLISSNSSIYTKKNIVEEGFSALESYGMKIKPEDKILEWPFNINAEKQQINKLIKKNNLNDKYLLIGIHVGTRNIDPRKGLNPHQWDTHKWVKVIEYLTDKYKSHIVFIGNGNDMIQTKEIISLVKNKKNILSVVNKLNLHQTVALVDKCNLFISTNSGPMWIAAALRKSQIALCGPSLLMWNPYNDKAITIRGKNPNTRDCFCSVNNSVSCKFGNNLCMKSIEYKTVLGSIDKVLKN